MARGQYPRTRPCARSSTDVTRWAPVMTIPPVQPTLSGTLALLLPPELLAQLDGRALESISAAMEHVFLPAGATLMRQGELADSFYIVINGRLRAAVCFRGTERIVAEIGPNEPVG